MFSKDPICFGSLYTSALIFHSPLVPSAPFCTPSHVSTPGLLQWPFLLPRSLFLRYPYRSFFTSFKSLLKCHLCSESKPKLTIENFILHQYTSTSISSPTLFFPQMFTPSIYFTYLCLLSIFLHYNVSAMRGGTHLTLLGPRYLTVPRT